MNHANQVLTRIIIYDIAYKLVKIINMYSNRVIIFFISVIMFYTGYTILLTLEDWKNIFFG